MLGELYKSSKGGVLHTVSPQELAKAEDLFLRALRGETGDGIAGDWKDLGYRMIDVDRKGRRFVVLIEEQTRQHGRGIYVFQPEAKGHIGLFMPHRFTDELTGPIGLSMMREHSFPVAAWNTVPRKGRGESWDFGKLPDTYFVALTKAFAKAYPKGYHVQLHGFDREKRKSDAGAGSDVILSGGALSARKEILVLQACLKKEGFGRVKVYPTDIRELGGTRNISGITLRSMGHHGFVHMEVSLDLRRRLKDEAEYRAALARCLSDALR
ncbi:MAG: hypothetical protein AB1646_18215 [Thermodesulfobacteriota bacterium]